MAKRVGKICEVEGKEGTFWLVRKCRDNARVRPLDKPDDPGENVPASSIKNPRKHEEQIESEPEPSPKAESGTTTSAGMAKPPKK